MIAMILGLLIVAGVISIFLASNRSTKYSDGLRSMQENGRQAITVLQTAIRQSGYSSTNAIMAIDLASSGSNSITVRSESLFDCVGNSTAAAPSPGIASNRYSFDGTTNQILCAGSMPASPTMPVADNVELFRILYGIDVNGDGVVEQFVRYPEVNSVFDVLSVQVGVLVVSDLPIKDQIVSKNYHVLDAMYASNDSFGRQVYQATVSIRNKTP